MTNEHDYTGTIAAFIDGEPVVPVDLRDALARSEGRDYLVELLALRELVGREPEVDALAVTSPRGKWHAWRPLALAAALLLAVLGGYLVGLRQVPSVAAPGTLANGQSETAPEPTVVVVVERWQDTTKGGGS